MMNKKVLAMFLFFLSASFSFDVFAGELVWGPQKYVRGTGKPYPVTDTFTIEKPKGKFWLQVSNGGFVPKPGAKPGVVEPVNQVSSAYVKLNGVEIVSPNDLNQNVYGVDKDITLQSSNTIEVEVRGQPGSYITVEIRKAELNPTVENKDNDLWGNNMEDIISLWWEGDESASMYILYKAYSIDGPWSEWTRITVSPDVRTNAVDGTTEAKTKDLCYKIEALDSGGVVIRQYEPICVPKWQEEESSLPLTKKTTQYKLSKGGSANPFFKKGRWEASSHPSFQYAVSSAAVRFLFASSTSSQSCSPPYNGMCLGNDDFTNVSSMSYEDIKKFLKDNKSFLKEDNVMDVDGISINPAWVIWLAAQSYSINPQIILTILQRENSAITKETRLKDSKLKTIMNYNTSNPTTIFDQIFDAAAQMRRDFDKISNGGTTISGWGVGITKKAIDGNKLSVTPSSIVVALLFSYDPEMGYVWDKTSSAGGNSLFCNLWKKFKFIIACKSGNAAPLSISGPDNPTDGSCYTASGGAPTYTWSIDKGKIDISGKVSGLSDQCGTATVTVKDSCGATQSKTVTLSTAEITISGPDAPSDSSQYTATGGKSPYSWTISKGSITQNGVVTVSGQCGNATITVTDACGNTGSKEVRMLDGTWVEVSYVDNYRSCYYCHIYGQFCTVISGGTKYKYEDYCLVKKSDCALWDTNQKCQYVAPTCGFPTPCFDRIPESTWSTLRITTYEWRCQ